MDDDHRSNSFYKIALAGAPQVGKTCLLNHYMQGRCDIMRLDAPGLQLRATPVTVDSTPARVAFWDVTGQDRHLRLRNELFSGAHAVALVYDVVQPATFFDLLYWYEALQGIVPLVPMVVIGNKTDQRMVVPPEEARGWATGCGMAFALTSALTGAGVEDAFNTLARSALQEHRRRTELRRSLPGGTH